MRYNKGRDQTYGLMALAAIAAPVFACIYLAQAANEAPRMRDHQRAKVNEHIAQLEAEIAEGQRPQIPPRL